MGSVISQLSDAAIWAMIAAASAIVFGAGALVEKIKTSKYVSKDVCAAHREKEDERWEAVCKSLARLEDHLINKPSKQR